MLLQRSARLPLSALLRTASCPTSPLRRPLHTVVALRNAAPSSSPSSAVPSDGKPSGAPIEAPAAEAKVEPFQHPSGLTFSGTGTGKGLDVPNSRPAYFQPSPHSEFVHRYWYLLKVMGFFSRKAETGVSSEDLFRSIEEQATQEVWWEALGIQRNWITEQALISLHVWLLHNRFKVEYNCEGLYNGRRMQEQIFERLWEDTTMRIRNAGIAEISVNKQLENVQKITFDDFFGYDAAIKADAKAEAEQEEAGAGSASEKASSSSTSDKSTNPFAGSGNMELAAALWKGVFREDENANTEAVLRLADYTMRELISILTQPKEDVYRGWITWGPCVGETEEMRFERQRRMLEGEWREALHLDGRVYFYHTTTHETRWDPPTDGLYSRRRFSLTQYLKGKELEDRLKLEAGGKKGGVSAALPATPASAEEKK